VRRTAVGVAAALGLGLMGCGTQARIPARSLIAVLPCTTGSIQLVIGAQLRVGGCGAGTTAQVSSRTLRQVGPFAFTVVTAGTAVVTLTGGPHCPAGSGACPQFRVDLGTIRVIIR
jgi:hypothetical protein